MGYARKPLSEVLAEIEQRLNSINQALHCSFRYTSYFRHHQHGQPFFGDVTAFVRAVIEEQKEKSFFERVSNSIKTTLCGDQLSVDYVFEDPAAHRSVAFPGSDDRNCGMKLVGALSGLFWRVTERLFSTATAGLPSSFCDDKAAEKEARLCKRRGILKILAKGLTMTPAGVILSAFAVDVALAAVTMVSGGMLSALTIPLGIACTLSALIRICAIKALQMGYNIHEEETKYKIVRLTQCQYFGVKKVAMHTVKAGGYIGEKTVLAAAVCELAMEAADKAKTFFADVISLFKSSQSVTKDGPSMLTDLLQGAAGLWKKVSGWGMVIFKAGLNAWAAAVCTSRANTYFRLCRLADKFGHLFAKRLLEEMRQYIKRHAVVAVGNDDVLLCAA